MAISTWLHVFPCLGWRCDCACHLVPISIHVACSIGVRMQLEVAEAAGGLGQIVHAAKREGERRHQVPEAKITVSLPATPASLPIRAKANLAGSGRPERSGKVFDRLGYLAHRPPATCGGPSSSKSPVTTETVHSCLRLARLGGGRGSSKKIYSRRRGKQHQESLIHFSSQSVSQVVSHETGRWRGHWQCIVHWHGYSNPA